MVAGGGDALELVKEYYDRIKYIHLKDWNGKEFVPLGKGNAKLRRSSISSRAGITVVIG